MPLDKGTRDGVTIRRAPEGGYYVMEDFRDPFTGAQILFASSTLKDAQTFLVHILEPVERAECTQ